MALVTVQRSPNTSADSSSTPSECGEEIHQRRRYSLNESYFSLKGPISNLPQSYKSTGKYGDSLHNHLQSMFFLLRPQDIIKLAVRLEGDSKASVTRYLVVVSTMGRQDTEESVILGLDYGDKATIGIALPIWSDTKVTLDGDGGFRIATNNRYYIFKPVSVKAMWSALQCLFRCLQIAHVNNYFVGGLNLTWTSYYEANVSSDRQCRLDWHLLEDIESHRPESPSSIPTERQVAEKLIRVKLKEVMLTLDLENVNSKQIRTCLEREMDMELQNYKKFIDDEMIIILRQMDRASEIQPYLFLGSEWNASNLEELKDNGVGCILNVTKEIDNFFPGIFHYKNIRLYDVEASDLLSHFESTYQYISKAKREGVKVLVHCKMGISRSASTVIAFVMKEYNMSLGDAVELVRSRRSCIRPNQGFVRQLETYEGILNASHQRLRFQTVEASAGTEDVEMVDDQVDHELESSTQFPGSIAVDPGMSDSMVDGAPGMSDSMVVGAPGMSDSMVVGAAGMSDSMVVGAPEMSDSRPMVVGAPGMSDSMVARQTAEFPDVFNSPTVSEDPIFRPPHTIDPGRFDVVVHLSSPPTFSYSEPRLSGLRRSRGAGVERLTVMGEFNTEGNYSGEENNLEEPSICVDIAEDDSPSCRSRLDSRNSLGLPTDLATPRSPFQGIKFDFNLDPRLHASQESLLCNADSVENLSVSDPSADLGMELDDETPAPPCVDGRHCGSPVGCGADTDDVTVAWAPPPSPIFFRGSANRLSVTEEEEPTSSDDGHSASVKVLDTSDCDGQPLLDTKAPLSDIRASLSETTTPLSETTALLSDTRALLSDTRAPLSDTTTLLSDTKAPLSDIRASLSDTTALLSDTKSPLSDNTTPLSETTTPLSDTRALLSDTRAPSSDKTILLSDTTTPLSDPGAPRSDPDSSPGYHSGVRTSTPSSPSRSPSTGAEDSGGLYDTEHVHVLKRHEPVEEQLSRLLETPVASGASDYQPEPGSVRRQTQEIELKWSATPEKQSSSTRIALEGVTVGESSSDWLDGQTDTVGQTVADVGDDAITSASAVDDPDTNRSRLRSYLADYSAHQPPTEFVPPPGTVQRLIQSTVPRPTRRSFVEGGESQEDASLESDSVRVRTGTVREQAQGFEQPRTETSRELAVNLYDEEKIPFDEGTVRKQKADYEKRVDVEKLSPKWERVGVASPERVGRQAELVYVADSEETGCREPRATSLPTSPEMEHKCIELENREFTVSELKQQFAVLSVSPPSAPGRLPDSEVVDSKLKRSHSFGNAGLEAACRPGKSTRSASHLANSSVVTAATVHTPPDNQPKRQRFDQSSLPRYPATWSVADGRRYVMGRTHPVRRLAHKNQNFTGTL